MYETIQNEHKDCTTHILNTKTQRTLCGRKTNPTTWKRYWTNQIPQLTQIDSRKCDCNTCKNKYQKIYYNPL